MIFRGLKMLVVAGISAVSVNVFSQINSVSYQLLFNDKTSLYECYLNVNDGKTTLSKHKVQFNAQISLVLPTGSEIAIVENFMPVENNSKTPQKWQITNRINKGFDGSDFVGIVPKLSPVGYYNDMEKGDKVKLFSFRVSPLPKCGEGVRLFDNTKDPNSKAMDMNGGDFSNGFTIGSVAQKYDKNLEIINTALPQGTIPSVADVYETNSIKLQSGIWTNADNYVWTGPNGFFSTQQNPTISKLSFKNAGEYTLTVKSEAGCSTQKSINLNVLPVDALVKADQNDLGNESINAKFSSITSTTNTAISVFPNPATNFINLKIDGYKGADVQSNIFDIDGRIVLKNVFNQVMETNTINKTIPLKLTGGLYTVVTTIDGVDHTSKFLYVE